MMTYKVPETHQPCKGARTELPKGLKELSVASEVNVSRNVNVLEVFLCCTPRQATFSVSTEDEEILTIRESGLCVFRECLGASRNLFLRVFNVEDENVAFFQRSMTCSRGCCGSSCCPPSMAVNSPPYIRLGSIQEQSVCCRPTFTAITNNADEPLLTYKTNCCYIKTCNLCGDIEIDVNDAKTEELVAKITKYSKGDCREWCNLKNEFTVKYLTDLGIIKRLMPCKGEENDLPVGLKELSTVPEILISRNVKVLEVLVCCNPRQASFVIYSNTKEQEEILRIKESGMCLFRECIGAARDLNFRVNNCDGDTVASFFRPIACSRGCCLSAGPPYIAVNSPPNVRLGTVQERVTCCNPVFDALPINDKQPILTYSTNECYLKTCYWYKDVEIEITDPFTEEVVAKILKKSKSDVKELLSLKNDFIVQFTPDLDISRRLMVIAACMLFNFNNFEYDRRYCC